MTPEFDLKEEAQHIASFVDAQTGCEYALTQEILVRILAFARRCQDAAVAHERKKAEGW